MIMILNKIKYWLVAGGLLFLYLLGYQKGKTSAEIKVMKGTIDVVKKAKVSRDSLSDGDHINRLHNKYKR